MKNQICEAMERYGASNLTNKQLLTVLLNGNKKLPALFRLKQKNLTSHCRSLNYCC